MTETDIGAISRLLAGELSPDEATALQARIAQDPDLARARDRLLNLDFQARALPAPPLPPGTVDRWVAAATGVAPTRGWPSLSPATQRRAAGALLAAAAVLLTVLALRGRSPAPASFREVEGAVAVLSGGPMHAAVVGGGLGPGDRVATLAGARASIDLGSGAAIDLAPRTQAELRPGSPLGVAVEIGEVVAAGSLLLVEAAGTSVEVRGRASVRVEPSAPADRAIGVEGEPMPSARMATAAIAALVTVTVFEGRAEVAPEPPEPRKRLTAPDRWQGSSGRAATSVAPPRPVLPPPVPAAPAVPAIVAADEFTGWPREALEAEVRTLRARLRLGEASAVRDGRTKTRSPEPSDYRPEPASLRKWAEEGRVELRLPQLDTEPVKVPRKVQSDLNLTDAESRAIEDVYRESHDRIADGLRRLYQDAGGSPAVAEALDLTSLLSEIRGKSAGNDHQNAVRQVAGERAGLRPRRSDAESTIVERAFRMLSDEDWKTLDDVDGLLGTARSRAFHQHEDARHSNYGMGVGPEKAKK